MYLSCLGLGFGGCCELGGLHRPGGRPGSHCSVEVSDDRTGLK